MQNIAKKAMRICAVLTLLVSSGIWAASQSSSSSSSSKRSSPVGERVNGQEEKRQRRPASQDGKKVLTIMREEYVPGERGTVKIQEKVDLLALDHISKKSFIEHLTEDRQRKLPWIIALITYKQKGGSFARDYADGRYWHQFLTSSSATHHPLYNGRLIGYPVYYAVRVIDNKLTTEYLGTEKEVAAKTPQGDLLRALLQLEPTSDTFRSIAYAYARKSDWDKAIEFYQLALAQLPAEGKPYGRVLFSLGFAYYKKQDWDKVIEYDQRAIEQLRAEGQPYGHALANLGLAYDRKQDLDKAIEFYAQAIELLRTEGKPYGKALTNLGQAYDQKQDWDKAIEFYSQAVEQLRAEGESYDQVLIDLGQAYFLKQDWDKMIEVFQQATELLRAKGKPYGLMYGPMLNKLGHAYAQKNDWEKAIEYYQLAFEYFHEETGKLPVLTLNSLGHVYEQSGQFDRAASSYMQAFDAGDIHGLISLMYVCSTQNCESIPKDKLIEYAQRLLSLSPNDSDVRFYKQKYPERFAVAQQLAERLVAGAQGLQDDV